MKGDLTMQSAARAVSGVTRVVGFRAALRRGSASQISEIDR